MKKFFILLLMTFTFTCAKPSTIYVKICKEKDYDCQVHQVDNVVSYEYITSLTGEKFLRVHMKYDYLTDYRVGDKYVEVKK